MYSLCFILGFYDISCMCCIVNIRSSHAMDLCSADFVVRTATGSSARVLRAGYVNLTDQLNEMREELEEKIDEQV